MFTFLLGIILLYLCLVMLAKLIFQEDITWYYAFVVVAKVGALFTAMSIAIKLINL